MRSTNLQRLAICLLIAASPAAETAMAQECYTVPNGLVSWWSGDVDGRDIEDGNDGMLENGATSIPGLVGNAFDFDGQDDMVVIPDSAGLRPSSITLAAWVRLDATSGTNAI